MTNVLVIGGSGFIGSHLAERLTAKRYKVRALARKNSDTRFMQSLGTELYTGDLLEPDSLTPAFSGIDTVFCLVNVKPTGKSQAEYLNELDLLHTEGTRNLLAACRLNKISRLIYLSSVAAIGYKKGVAVYSESSPEEPIDAYGRAKLKAEKILMRDARNSEVKVTILRPPGVFGERGLGSLSKIIGFAEKGIVPVLGSGNNRQSLVYVGNVVNQSIFAADSPDSSGKVYITSDDRPYTVNELVDAVAGEMGVRPFKIHIPVWSILFMLSILNFLAKIFLKKEAVNKESIIAIATERIFDGSGFFRELGYRQEYDLAEGVRRTVKWYKGQKNG
ncbi:NAD(P)-dependent oxidoreductase [bacterium]|nr:MAG: NAD(P)-dependent oxidoreductase [bacterium]